MAKVVRVTKKHYYNVQIDNDYGESFCFNVDGFTSDGELLPLDESDFLILNSMIMEDKALSQKLFDEIIKRITGSS